MADIKIYLKVVRRKIDMLLKDESTAKEVFMWASCLRTYFYRNYRIFDLKYSPPLVLIERIIYILRYDDRGKNIGKEELEHILEMLRGNCNDNYLFTIRVPSGVEILQTHIKMVNQIKSMIPKLLANVSLKEDDMLFLAGLKSYEIPKTTLFTDLIFIRIISLFVKTYSIYDTENCEFSNEINTTNQDEIYFMRFDYEENRNIVKCEVINKLKNLVDCYLGLERFLVIISFVSGKPYVSF
jgi:hypothetical protein